MARTHAGHDTGQDLADAFDEFRSLLTKLDRQHHAGRAADELRDRAARQLDQLAHEARDHLVHAESRRPDDHRR